MFKSTLVLMRLPKFLHRQLQLAQIIAEHLLFRQKKIRTKRKQYYLQPARRIVKLLFQERRNLKTKAYTIARSATGSRTKVKQLQLLEELIRRPKNRLNLRKMLK